MPKITESCFKFELPDERYFRFEDCSTYEEYLAGQRLKEMDFAWLEGDDSTVWLMEVKYFVQQGSRHFSSDEEKERIVTKIRDALTMISAVWFQTDKGQKLLEEIRETCPGFPDSFSSIELIVAVGLDREDASMLVQGLLADVREELRGVLSLYDISEVGLVLLNDETNRSTPIPIEAV